MVVCNGLYEAELRGSDAHRRVPKSTVPERVRAQRSAVCFLRHRVMSPSLDKAVVRELATCAWVLAKQNVIVVGASGVGYGFGADS